MQVMALQLPAVWHWPQLLTRTLRQEHRPAGKGREHCWLVGPQVCGGRQGTLRLHMWRLPACWVPAVLIAATALQGAATAQRDSLKSLYRCQINELCAVVADIAGSSYLPALQAIKVGKCRLGWPGLAQSGPSPER